MAKKKQHEFNLYYDCDDMRLYFRVCKREYGREVG